jgi:hypothetical protein
MTHATPEEIHDHAYGFRISEHVSGCASCRQAADAVAGEREALKDALRDSSQPMPADLLVRLGSVGRPRRRFGAPALAAAALLLGALTWMLFQPRGPVAPLTSATATTPEEDLEKLLERLKGPSPLKQELARLAFRKYGGIALPVLERAKADPILIDECRGFNDADRTAYRKAQTTRLTVKWQDTSLIQAIDRLRQASGLNFHITGIPNPDAINADLQMTDATVLEILDRLSQITKIPWGRSAGLDPRFAPYRPNTYAPVFFFGAETPAPGAFAPVRVPSAQPWVDALLRDPESLSVDEVRRRLPGLIPGIHEGLWLLLDSSRPEIRQLAADALRRAYGPSPEPSRSALEAELTRQTVTDSFEQIPCQDVLLSIGSSKGVPLVQDPRLPIDHRLVTFKVKDLNLKNSLKLLVSQFSLDILVCDHWVLITQKDLAPYRPRDPQPMWRAPDEAKEIQGWIADLASDDPTRHQRAREAAKEAGRGGLDWLVHASSATEPPLSTRYGEVLRSVATELGIRLADQPASAAAQPLTPAQKAIRSRTLKLKSADKTLETLLKENGVKTRFLSPVSDPILVAGGDLPVDALLRAVLHPLGLDYFMDGETVVIDTADKARAAVERK